MTTTIENINGTDCLVIRKPFDAEWVKQQLSLRILPTVEVRDMDKVEYITIEKPYLNYHGVTDTDGRHHPCFTLSNTLTILPPLPRNPKPDAETAQLIAKYISHGIIPCFGDEDLIIGFWKEWTGNIALGDACGEGWVNIFKHEITHGIYNGKCIELAFKEE